MQIRDSFTVAAPPDRVARTLAGEAYNLEAARMRDEVTGAEYRLLEETGAEVRFQVVMTEYKRTMTGGIDRSGTTRTTLHNRWHAPDGTLTWRYEGSGEQPGADRVRIGGAYRLSPEGTGTRVTHEVTVEVNIPLLGGRIARFVAKEFEASFERDRRLLERHVREAAAEEDR
jgi:carbon monoxide dehydrogenase subunit G